MEVCAECGARFLAESGRCDLCGWPVGKSVVRRPKENQPGGIYCNLCGWESPSASNFCSQCGAKLQNMSAKRPPPPQPPKPRKRPANVESGVGMQVFTIVGLGVFLVAVLFIVTVVSKRVSPPQQPTLSAAPSTTEASSQSPLSDQLASRINELDMAIESDTSALSLVLKREKIYVLVEGGRPGMAAEVQSEIAEETGLAADWKTAGDLYYEWMADEPEPQIRSFAADQAVRAYQRILEMNPNDLDVRTDMATAYLNTGSPMLGVTEIKKVLEEDPNHLNANFNYGLMLARINRTEEAVTQLERVLTLSPDSTSMHYQRAAMLISTIREQTNL